MHALLDIDTRTHFKDFAFLRDLHPTIKFKVLVFFLVLPWREVLIGNGGIKMVETQEKYKITSMLFASYETRRSSILV